MSGFLRGSNDVERSFDDVSAAARDTTRVGETNADRLARAYQTSAREMSTAATEGGGGFTQTMSHVLDRGASTIARTAKGQMKSLGKGLASDMAGGISSFDPANVAGSFGSLLGSVSAAGPVVAAGLGIATLVVGSIVSGVQTKSKEISEAGSAAAEALMKGAMTGQAKFSMVEKLLGLDEGDQAGLAAKLTDLGNRVGATSGEIFDYIASGGKTTTAAIQAGLASLDIRGKTHEARDFQTSIIELRDITADYGTAWDDANTSVGQQKALIDGARTAAEQLLWSVKKVNTEWSKGSVYQSQVPAYTPGKRP